MAVLLLCRRICPHSASSGTCNTRRDDLSRMSKLTKLKSFYKLDEAAQRLTVAFGEPVTVSDVLQFVIDQRLTLAAQFLRQYAKPVIPYTLLVNWYGGGDSDPTAMPVLRQVDGRTVRRATMSTNTTQGDLVVTLDGVYRLFTVGPLVKAYVQHMLMGNDAEDFELTSTGGVLVLDGSELMYELSERHEFSAKEKAARILRQATAGLPQKPWLHVDHFFPSVRLPASRHLVIRTVDLARFELSEARNEIAPDASASVLTSNPSLGTARAMSNEEVLKLKAELKAKGYRDFNQRAAKAAGIHPSRLRQIGQAQAKARAPKGNWY